MKRTHRAALACSATLLVLTASTGCAALKNSPISNATANPNPAIAEAKSHSAPVKDDKREKPSEGTVDNTDSSPMEAAPQMQAVAKSTDMPAWAIAINWASTKLGHKYVWGGESEEEGGYDCSGLMLAAYAQAGINLPRVANDQYQATDNHPKESDLQLGDLVFFGKTARGIHHVGLYVGKDAKGNPMMLHAPNSRSVIRFDKVHYMSDYYGATRVIP